MLSLGKELKSLAGKISISHRFRPAVPPWFLRSFITSEVWPGSESLGQWIGCIGMSLQLVWVWLSRWLGASYTHWKGGAWRLWDDLSEYWQKGLGEGHEGISSWKHFTTSAPWQKWHPSGTTLCLSWQRRARNSGDFDWTSTRRVSWCGGGGSTCSETPSTWPLQRPFRESCRRGVLQRPLRFLDGTVGPIAVHQAGCHRFFRCRIVRCQVCNLRALAKRLGNPCILRHQGCDELTLQKLLAISGKESSEPHLAGFWPLDWTSQVALFLWTGIPESLGLGTFIGAPFESCPGSASGANDLQEAAPWLQWRSYECFLSISIQLLTLPGSYIETCQSHAKVDRGTALLEAVPWHPSVELQVEVTKW